MIYKVLTADMNHNGYQYKLGLNALDEPFNPAGRKGGFYCCELHDVPSWLLYKDNLETVCEITFHHDSQIIYQHKQFKTDKFYIANPMPIHDFLIKHDMWLQTIQTIGKTIKHYKGTKTYELCLEAIRKDGMALEYIKNEQTEELCQMAVKNDGLSLQYVVNQTDSICRNAIINNPKAIRYMKNQTPELCSLAIKLGAGLDFIQTMTPEICYQAVCMNGNFLKYIPQEKHTPEIRMRAIEQSPEAIEWINTPSHEECMVAITKNWRTLQHIQNQTPEVCMKALQINGLALQYVKEKMLHKICSYAIQEQIPAIYFLNSTKPSSWTDGFLWGSAFAFSTIILLKNFRRV